MCNGLADSVGYERDVATDGGFSCRTFLGAAAALAALPQSASAEMSDPDNVIEDRSVTDDGTYSVTDCGSVPGGLNNVNVTADMNEARSMSRASAKRTAGAASDSGGHPAPSRSERVSIPTPRANWPVVYRLPRMPRRGNSMTDVTRRQHLGGVAALAATRSENDDYDIENVESWDSLKGGTYTTGTLTPQQLTTSGEGTVSGWLLEDYDFTDRTMEVFYDPDAVHLTLEAQGKDLRGGGLTGLTTNQARDLAASLFQAAEELDRQQEVSDADQ